MSAKTSLSPASWWRGFRDSEQAQIVKRVFADNFKHYRNRYFLAIGLMVIASAATGFSAWMMREVINSILQARSFSIILAVGFTVIAIFVIKGFATYGHTVTLAMVGNELSAEIQKRVFNHLLSLKAEYFDRTTLGEIFTRATMGVTAARQIIDTVIMTVCVDLLTLLFLGLVMFIQEPLISIGVLVIGPVSVLFIRSIVRKTREQATRLLENLSHSSSLLKETVGGIMMIKTYSLEDEMSTRMGGVVEEMRGRNDRIAKLQARTSPIMETLGGIAIGVLVIYAGWWALNVGTDGLDPDYPGKLMSFITAFLLAYAPAKRLARLRVTLEKLFADVRYMYELLDREQPESLLFEGGEELMVKAGNVEVKNLNFGYGEHQPVLRDVSLAGAAGEKIGLVGPSGGGKSTIFKVLMALYQPTSGQVMIDGQDIFKATPGSVRGAIAYVGQEAHIFSGTVKENIAFGALGASDEEIVEAAKLAKADEFIAGFRDGYDTFVGENGAQLSGGQRQRIAIARAFLKKAPIILLDEATSSLDTESEQAIQAAIEELVEGKTTFIIAHRLSTVQKCDRIYVVAGGAIVEQGSHAKLIDDDRTYAQLFKLQFAS